MEEIKIEYIKPILKDERGLFFEVINNLLIKHIVVTTFLRGAIRGNQYRKNTDQFFFLTLGKIKLITQSMSDKMRKEVIMIPGSLVYIPREVAFASIAEEDSILLEFSPQAYDQNNPDINRIKIV
ncbi:MAG: hypothetical protein ACT4OW_03175 [Nitrososphaerota archaeon]